jgi:hypothetical protein
MGAGATGGEQSLFGSPKNVDRFLGRDVVFSDSSLFFQSAKISAADPMAGT